MPVVELMLTEEQVKWLEENGYETKAEHRCFVPGEAFISSTGEMKVHHGWSTAGVEFLCFRKAAPPPPVWRAWRSAVEVPREMVWFRRANWSEGARSPFKVGRSGFSYVGSEKITLLSYEEAFRENAKVSADGLHWHRCGIESKGE